MVLEIKKRIGPLFGVRHLQCLLLFSCQIIMFTVLLNVPLAIVAMVDSSTANPDFPEFDWDETTRANILTSFFWGYMIFQIPYGSLTIRYGCKLMLLIGVTVNSLSNLIIPELTIWGGSTALITVRGIQGVFQGVVFPATHGLLANWAPVEERSVLSILVYPGAQIGAIIALVTGGQVAASSLGWPGIFYLWGLIGLVWCVVYWYYGSNSPMDHKTISKEELDYIVSSKGGQSENTKLPWKKVLRSVPFYSLIITDICATYCYWTVTNITPTYLKGIFGVNIKENAFLSSVPMIGMFILSHVFGALGKITDHIFKLKIRTTRILFNTIGFVVPAFALFGLNFVTKDDVTLTIFLLTTSYAVLSAVYLGYFVNHMDLCPSHAGFLMGVTNSLSTISGIFAMQAVGWLVKDETDPAQWRIIFNIGGVCFIVGALVFAFFARFEDQKWIEVKEITSTPQEINSSETEVSRKKSIDENT